jgi:hypothetical protein
MYVDETSWGGVGSPIFLYISGEGPMDSYPTGYWTDLAAKHSAMVITLEHRFYGVSVPRMTYTNDNLELLTVEQALADLHYFLGWIKSEYQTASSRAVIIGGSYSGALSSWYKITYPDDVVAAWSSSGVVNAIEDFYEFDQTIAKASGDKCANIMRQLTSLLENGYPTVKAHFGAQALNRGDFFYMIADGLAMATQYGKGVDLCRALEESTDLIQTVAAYLPALWGPSFTTSCFYDTACLKYNNTQDRSWNWQTCKQLAYFNTAPAVAPIRSRVVDLHYHKISRCLYVFNTFPDVSIINTKFGGAEPKAENVIYLDASADPWQDASVRETVSPSQPFHYIQFANASHCIDLHSPLPGDPQSLVDARTAIANFLTTLL